MAITKEKAQEMLEIWLKADEAVAKNQEYRIGDRTYTRADAAVITEKITYYSNIVDSYSPRKRRVHRFTY